MIALLAVALLAAAPPAAPLTLDDALALASRHNGEVRLARLEAESAEVERWASWASVLPRLDLGASFGRSYLGAQQRVTTAPRLTTDLEGNPALTFEQQTVEIPGAFVNDFGLGLRLQQPLFDGLRGPRLIERARRGVEVAARELDEAGLALSLAVTQRFLEALKADRGAGVLEETVARSEEFLARAEALFGAGRLPKSEAIAARVNLGNDRIGLESQRARVAAARAELALVLGVPAAQIGELAPPAEVDLDAPALREPPPAEELVARAQQARPAFARARALLEQARLDEQIAGADRWPIVTGALGYERGGPTFAGWDDGVYGNPTRQFVASAQVAVSWNIFNGRQTQAAEQRAAIAARGVQVGAEQLAVQVEAELARARAAVVALGRAVALSAANLEAAAEGLRLAEQRLEHGAATQLEVRDASLKLTQAKLSLLNARIDALVARAELARAAGGAL